MDRLHYRLVRCGRDGLLSGTTNSPTVLEYTRRSPLSRRFRSRGHTMAVSPMRQWLGVGTLAAVVGVGLYLFWGRLFPAKIGEISARTDLPEIPLAKPAPGDWPWWRGPTLDNNSPDATAPTTWKESDIAWKKAIPGLGHSTPIVVGNKVILTTADEEAGTQSALALDRSTGEIL